MGVAATPALLSSSFSPSFTRHFPPPGQAHRMPRPVHLGMSMLPAPARPSFPWGASPQARCASLHCRRATGVTRGRARALGEPRRSALRLSDTFVGVLPGRVAAVERVEQVAGQECASILAAISVCMPGKPSWAARRPEVKDSTPPEPDPVKIRCAPDEGVSRQRGAPGLSERLDQGDGPRSARYQAALESLTRVPISTDSPRSLRERVPIAGDSLHTARRVSIHRGGVSVQSYSVMGHVRYRVASDRLLRRLVSGVQTDPNGTLQTSYCPRRGWALQAVLPLVTHRAVRARKNVLPVKGSSTRALLARPPHRP
jgi:hypothetical protein